VVAPSSRQIETTAPTQQPAPDAPGLSREEQTPQNTPAAPPEDSPAAQPTTPFSEPSCTPPIARRFGRYELLEEVAHGGMGVVYKAHDTLLERTVALKMLRAGLFASADEVERFQREARAVAQLNHPQIIKIYEVGQEDGRHYFTMPFVAGGNLTRCRVEGGAEPGTVVSLIEKVARAVQHAHEQGILHRDLKPDNVLLDKPDNVLLDEHGDPVVADFGLAKFLTADMELTRIGERPGTPSYMAPEQVAEPMGQVTVQTDVWALGVILYELLVGRRPFLGQSAEALRQAIQTSAPPRPGALRPALDRTLESIVLRCLTKVPEQRYPSASALADDLQRWSEGWRLPGERWPARVWHALWRHPRRAIVALLATVIVGFLFVLLIRPPAEPPITLIGMSGGPQQAVWRHGQAAGMTEISGPEGAFSVRCKDQGMVELAPSSPWPHYRLEALVRHEEDFNSGRVGVYFGYNQEVDADGSRHRFGRLAFSDFGVGRAVELRMNYRRSEGPRPMGHSVNLGGFHHPDWLGGAPGPWRELVVEVTAARVRAFLDGECIGDVPRARWLEQVPLWPSLPTVPAEFPPNGGLGLFVDHGKASFRQVILKPWPGGD
jgi:serine/threonine-protein kinase